MIRNNNNIRNKSGRGKAVIRRRRRGNRGTTNNGRFDTMNGGRRPKMTIERVRFEAIPDRQVAWFNYYENNYHLDLGTSDLLLHLDLALNDPFDPYIAIGGKSANLYYQMMTLYRYSRTMRAKVTVKYADNYAANKCPIQTALVFNSEGVSYANMDDIISLPLSKRIIHDGFTNRIGSTQTIQGDFDPNMAFYMTKSQWKALPAGSPYDNTNIGTVASPTNLSIVSLYWGRVDETNTDAVANIASISIQYEVLLYDRQSFTE